MNGLAPKVYIGLRFFRAALRASIARTKGTFSLWQLNLLGPGVNVFCNVPMLFMNDGEEAFSIS